MDLIADMLLLAATLSALFYCFVLSRRLRRFTALESGMGGAIAVLSAQVDDMTRALAQTQAVAGGSEKRLAELTAQADSLARRLEMMVASMHDIPDTANSPQKAAGEAVDDESDDGRRIRFQRRRTARERLAAAG